MSCRFLHLTYNNTLNITDTEIYCNVSLMIDVFANCEPFQGGGTVLKGVNESCLMGFGTMTLTIRV